MLLTTFINPTVDFALCLIVLSLVSLVYKWRGYLSQSARVQDIELRFTSSRWVLAVLIVGAAFGILSRVYLSYLAPGDVLADTIPAQEFLHGRSLYPSDLNGLVVANLRDHPPTEPLSDRLARLRSLQQEQFYASRLNLVNAHPPLFTLAVVPLVWASGIYFPAVIINLTALILYGYALYQLIGALFSPPRHAWWLTLMVLGLGWQPVLASLRHANLSLIISSLVLLCWYFMRRGREALGGVILGLAISLKIHPCILLVYLIGKRWRAFAAAVITTAFFAVVAWLCVGSQDVLRFVATTRFLTKTFGRSRDNASVFSVIFGVTHLDESSIIGTVILGGVAVLFVIFAMWAINSKAQRGSSPAEREDTNFAIAICLMSLISPIVWPHYFSVMLLPLALIAKYGAEWSQDGIKKIGFLVLVLVLSLPDQPLAAVSHALRSQFGDQLGWFLGSFQTFALLGVMVWLVTIRTRPAIGDVNAQTG